MHVETFDAKVNKIQWKQLPIGFQSVYQSVQIEKGLLAFLSKRRLYSFITKSVITKPKILPLHVFNTSSRCATIEFKANAIVCWKCIWQFSLSFVCKRLKCLTALSNMKWFAFKSVVTQAGKVETFFVSSRNLPLAVAGPLIN